NVIRAVRRVDARVPARDDAGDLAADGIAGRAIAALIGVRAVVAFLRVAGCGVCSGDRSRDRGESQCEDNEPLGQMTHRRSLRFPSLTVCRTEPENAVRISEPASWRR